MKKRILSLLCTLAMLFSFYSFMIPVRAAEISDEMDTGAYMEDYEANVLLGNELQVIVKATDNAKTFRLWRLAEGSDKYELVRESKYPILIYENYLESDKYAVSIVSNLLDTESEKYEIKKFRSEVSSSGTDSGWVSNILEGLTMVPNPDAPTNVWGSEYTYEKLTDGGFLKRPDGKEDKNAYRFAAKSAKDVLDATVSLGNTYLINEIRLYDYYGSGDTRAGDNIVIYTLTDGVWVEAARLDGKDAVIAAKLRDEKENLTYVSFKLGYVAASSIRVVCSNDDTATLDITIYEITASGIALEDENIRVDNVLAGKSFTGNATIYATQYGYDTLTDGKFGVSDGRFALKAGTDNVVLECELNALYALYELKIYDWCDNGVSRMKNVRIELYYCGTWVTVISGASMTPWNDRVSDGKGKATVFDLGGAKGEKIRISCNDGSGSGISIYEIACEGVKCVGESAGTDAFKNNVKSVSVAPATVYPNYPLSYGFDGDFSTRYAVHDTYPSYVLEIELNKVQKLYNLNIYDFKVSGETVNGKQATRSDRTYIELYVDGEWVRIIDNVSMRVDPAYTSFYLYGIAASKIRIGFNNTRAFDNGKQGAASVYEITCSSAADIVDRKPILEAYEKLDTVAFGKEDHAEKMKKFYSYLSDFDLDAEAVSARSVEMNAYYETVRNNVISYVPKTSITLGSELSVNVYLPTKNLQKFTLDGVTYENLELLKDKKLVLSNGEECYKMTILLPVSEAGREIKLKAYVSSDEVNATATFTISIPKYSTKAIEKGTDVEKTLIRDVLSYIRAGYVFFEKDASVIDQIDAIIGANYDATSPHVPEGSTNVPTMFKSATFNLDSTPTVRFYLNDGENAENCSFKINGTTKSFITSTNDKGAYVEIPVYAYAMCETIECYYGGAYVGSYHIASYYNWAKTQNNDDLVKLVERFWKYCQSARDHKNSVAIQINYVDEAGNKMAESYVNRYKTGEAISVLSPSIEGYYTRDIYVMETVSSENNVFNVVYEPIPSGIDADMVDKYLSDIVCWGDSITAGACKNVISSAEQYGIDLEALGSASEGASYVTVLRNLIIDRVYSGISVRGCGVGGEATSTIASRADTETYYLYLNSAVTVSGGAVTIPLTHYSSGGRVGILRQGGSDELNPVTIVGKDEGGNEISVTGTISVSLTSDAPSGTDIRTCDAKYLKYTFTRTDGKTNTLNFVSGARVVTKASYLYDGRTCIIFMGENGGYKDTDELIKQQEEILKACGNPEYYLIISTTSGSYESRTEVREALSARWGEHYINMGDELNSSRKSYEFAGFSEEAILSIQQNIANGTVSNLLIKDTCHPNAVGYAVIGNIIFERLFKLGAFDELFDYYSRLNTVTTETFEFNGYTATVVRPANPNGKWIWKTEFFTAFDKAERTLLDDGYTRVYYRISNKYGNPESVSLMESFYHEVTDRYNLDDKCILFGFSRGGLYAFNFALECPQFVDKIYLDAPVLDLKTWPTKSKNPGEFSGMLASYGLTEEEFASFKGSPIDKLEEFFALKIPLLVVAGDADATVPFEDNAGRLIEYALSNGHNITYFVEEGKDHHPHSLTDVTPIVDFCNRGSYENVVSNPLTKEDFSGKTITFLGDSITHGVGASIPANRYSSQVASSLGMTEINMGISGTVMCTGGHRTSRLDDIQKISLDSDYVGILLGINDFDQCRNNGTSSYYALGEFGTSDTTTIYGALDKMCKDLTQRFGSSDTKVFLMTPVITSWNNSVSGTRDWNQDKVNACGYTLRELCDAIVEVATYYGIVTLDLNTLCEMNSADFSDGIHPNDSGAKKIADTIEEFLLANYSFE